MGRATRRVILVRPLHAPVVAAKRTQPGVVDGVRTRHARLKRRAAAEAGETIHELREECAGRRVEG